MVEYNGLFTAALGVIVSLLSFLGIRLYKTQDEHARAITKLQEDKANQAHFDKIIDEMRSDHRSMHTENRADRQRMHEQSQASIERLEDKLSETGERLRLEIANFAEVVGEVKTDVAVLQSEAKKRSN